MSFQSIGYRTLDQKVKQSIRKDLRTYNTQVTYTALTNNRSLKAAVCGINVNRSSIARLKNHNCVKQSNETKLIEICTQY